jgi:DNA-binding transcriptional LysR family regulator
VVQRPRRWLELRLQHYAVTVQEDVIARSPEAVKSHVMAGLGWGFASKHSVRSEVAAGHLVIVPVADWNCRRTFCGVHRRNHPLGLAQQKFLEMAQSVEKELAPSAA